MNEHPYLYQVDLQELKDVGTLYFLQAAEYKGRMILLTAFDPRDGSGLILRAFYGDRWTGNPLAGPTDQEQSPENPAMHNFEYREDHMDGTVSLISSYAQGVVLPPLWKLTVRVLSFFGLAQGPRDVTMIGLMDEAVRYYTERLQTEEV